MNTPIRNGQGVAAGPCIGLANKLMGGLSLMMSLPAVIVGFARCIRANVFKMPRGKAADGVWTMGGSSPGTAIGGFLLGVGVDQRGLRRLGTLLMASGIKTFQRTP